VKNSLTLVLFTVGGADSPTEDKVEETEVAKDPTDDDNDSDDNIGAGGLFGDDDDSDSD
jgi:hypothetical protein